MLCGGFSVGRREAQWKVETFGHGCDPGKVFLLFS